MTAKVALAAAGLGVVAAVTFAGTVWYHATVGQAIREATDVKAEWLIVNGVRVLRLEVSGEVDYVLDGPAGRQRVKPDGTLVCSIREDCSRRIAEAWRMP